MTCSLCAHLSRYRFGHTREQFKSFAEKYNIALKQSKYCSLKNESHTTASDYYCI